MSSRVNTDRTLDLGVLLFIAAATVALAVLMVAEVPATAMSSSPRLRQPAFGAEPGRPEGSADRPSVTRTTSDTKSSVFLPLITSARRSACPAESPFSLEIAALHQVEPSSTGALGPYSMTEAEWWALYQDEFPHLMAALKESGACWSRVQVDWAAIQPQPPPAGYVWGPYHDEKLRLLAETGVHLIAIVHEIPNWAAGSTQGPIDPDRLDEFSQFLTALVNRYKEPPYNIHHWELLNEPDQAFVPGVPDGWGYREEGYAQMLAVAYPAIKAADPDATVLMGGIAYDWFTEYGGPFHRYFLDDMIAAGGGKYFDVANYHYFPDFHAEWERWDPSSEDRREGWLPAPTCGIVDDGLGTPYEAGGIDLIAKASHFRNRLAACFGQSKPVWVTELGEHGYKGDQYSLVQQARYVIQGYARGLAAGVENITWFALVSPPYDPFDQGLLYQDDWAPKPAYYAYQTMTTELLGYSYRYTMARQDVEAYVFRNANQHEKVVAWNRYPEESATLTFAGASRIRMVDRNGNVSHIEDGGPGDWDGAQNGIVLVQMTADPVFLSR